MEKITELMKQDLTHYAPIPFWSWNDELEGKELRRQIRAMKDAHIGGFFMHARGGLTTEYLGEKWFSVTGECIDEAKKLGMDAWCYDENGWPSGFAGMKLLEDKNNWEHYLVCERRPGFDPEALCAFVLKGNELTRVAEDAGADEYILIYDRQNSSVVDILNPAIVRKFLDETHEKYYERFKDDFGSVMKGFFTDEPQYFRWDTPYTPVMLKVYRDRYGKDMLDELGKLFVECDGCRGFRWKYWKLMNDLYMESFARQIADWCEEHNCSLTGHSIEENGLFGQMMCCGGIMPFYKYQQKPGIDWLGRGIATEMAPRQALSTCQQLGRKQILTETFACAGWDVTPRELKRIAEWQYVNGINQMCHHLYPYSIRGQRKRDYPAFYSPHNTWTKPEDLRRFNDYFTRLGYMLANSREEARVAVIHPIHAAYLTFDRNDRECVAQLNRDFEELIEKLGAMSIGHHYVDETLLSEYGSVDGKTLKMGLCSYDTVVIPKMDTLDKSTARLLKEYVLNGGRLVLYGDAPKYIEGEEADLSFLAANTSLDELANESYSIDRKDTAVRSTMRHAPFGSFLYAVNLSESETCSVTYALAAKGAEKYDPENNVTEPLYFEKADNGIRVPLTLAPGESRVILLNDQAESGRRSVKPAEMRSLPTACTLAGDAENILTIDKARYSLDGENWSDEMYVLAIGDALLRGKTNRPVWLKYTFEADFVPEDILLECEGMHAREAYFNGERITFDLPGRFDPAFIAQRIAPVKGVNELVYLIDYEQPEEVYRVFNGVYYEHSDGTESLINCLSYRTDIEAVYLRGSFGVSVGECEDGIKNTIRVARPVLTEPVSSLDASRITRSGYPFFGGKMKLRFTFTGTGKETELSLHGRYTLAEVSVNGSAPRMLLFTDTMDVTGLVREGENELVIDLTSSYRNVFGPFHCTNDPEPFGVGPDTFSRYGTWEEGGVSKRYRPDYALVNFGLNEILIG